MKLCEEGNYFLYILSYCQVEIAVFGEMEERIGYFCTIERRV